MAAGIPDILSAHHIVLGRDVVIPKKSHQELKNYKQPVSVDRSIFNFPLELILLIFINCSYFLDYAIVFLSIMIRPYTPKKKEREKRKAYWPGSWIFNVTIHS